MLLLVLDVDVLLLDHPFVALQVFLNVVNIIFLLAKLVLFDLVGVFDHHSHLVDLFAILFDLNHKIGLYLTQCIPFFLEEAHLLLESREHDRTIVGLPAGRVLLDPIT